MIASLKDSSKLGKKESGSSKNNRRSLVQDEESGSELPQDPRSQHYFAPVGFCIALCSHGIDLCYVL